MREKGLVSCRLEPSSESVLEYFTKNNRRPEYKRGVVTPYVRRVVCLPARVRLGAGKTDLTRARWAGGPFCSRLSPSDAARPSDADPSGPVWLAGHGMIRSAAASGWRTDGLGKKAMF